MPLEVLALLLTPPSRTVGRPGADPLGLLGLTLAQRPLTDDELDTLQAEIEAWLNRQLARTRWWRP